MAGYLLQAMTAAAAMGMAKGGMDHGKHAARERADQVCGLSYHQQIRSLHVFQQELGAALVRFHDEP
jgi:hypothetical protein